MPFTVVVSFSLCDGEILTVKALTPAAHRDHSDESDESEDDGKAYAEPCRRNADFLPILLVVLILQICVEKPATFKFCKFFG